MPEPATYLTPPFAERESEPSRQVMIAAAAAAAPEHDCVDACGDASFPASDPPSWWSGR